MALKRLSLETYAQPITTFTGTDRHWLELNPPYQRGLVWPEEKKRNLIRSLLEGRHVGEITLNEREFDPTTPHLRAVVVDGKQRISAVREFVDGLLAVPAWWFDTDERGEFRKSTCGPIVHGSHTIEGVRWDDLLPLGRALFTRTMFAVTTCRRHSIEEEAELYLLINFGGVPQTEEDRARAELVAVVPDLR